jgi:3',5'-cyclic-AMP phosphodiesterase
MKIVQFTDIHIGAKEEETRNVDVRKNLDAVLAAIADENADMHVLTGDLCFKEPGEDIYSWIGKQLAEQNIHPLVIPGNHDNSVMLAHHFDMPLTGSEVYFERETGDTRILFLDTGRGKMSSRQWSWLGDRINSQGKLMIFMHHPPVHTFVPFMDDNHAFAQQDKFQQLLACRNDCVDVFCGHYHVDKSVALGNLHVHITPSCFFQIRDDIEEFGVDHYRIGYRVIEVDGGVLAHGVRYLD